MAAGAITCESGTVLISCPVGYTIQMSTAIYGRNSAGNSLTCPQDTKVSCGVGMMPTMTSRCNGKNDCTGTVDNGAAGTDPCKKIAKYMDYSWTCTPTNSGVVGKAPMWIIANNIQICS